MGVLRDTGRDGDGLTAELGAPAAPRPIAAPASPAAAPERDRSELRRRRDSLAEQVTELHWDLGGLAYEMAIRDHFRLDVLMRRAAILQERDAELAEIERLLKLEEEGAAGACPVCGAPHSRGALYCWQCGAGLMERRMAAGTSEQPTDVIEALLPRGADPGPADPFA
ncbi:MAG TPA: hypothetical protein VHT27_07515 [Solirubrobacteraceae bacterium]|jgi:hypothetical protein|nr:hypothetical protein [Solirubrobacteraceae bacterium]